MTLPTEAPPSSLNTHLYEEAVSEQLVKPLTPHSCTFSPLTQSRPLTPTYMSFSFGAIHTVCSGTQRWATQSWCLLPAALSPGLGSHTARSLRCGLFIQHGIAIGSSCTRPWARPWGFRGEKSGGVFSWGWRSGTGEGQVLPSGSSRCQAEESRQAGARLCTRSHTAVPPSLALAHTGPTVSTAELGPSSAGSPAAGAASVS